MKENERDRQTDRKTERQRRNRGERGKGTSTSIQNIIH